MPKRDIVAIGASAGGITALRTLVADLPEDFPASVFVVIHTSEDNPGRLPDLLNRRSKIPVLYAVHDTPVLPGRVYLAPPGRHVIVERGRIRLSTGPRENRHRPAVDVLFRSAAIAYGSRLIAVVLTGNLDDGALGLEEVKARGGVAIVQDPEDADAPSMPRNALEVVEPDFILPLAEIGPQIAKLVATAEAPAQSRITLAKEPENGSPSGAYSCPECGGVLEEIAMGSGTVKFKCRVGHSYGPESLMESQAESIERALWAGVRSLEEHAEFCQRLAQRFKGSNRFKLSDRFAERSDASRENAHILRELLQHAENVRRETDVEDATGTEG